MPHNKAMHRSPPQGRLKIVDHRGRTSVIFVDYEVLGLASDGRHYFWILYLLIYIGKSSV
jgi:hypothetical protein